MNALGRFDVERVSLSGTELVEASAGTGKTYAISTLVVRLLLETDISIERVLVVTFTEAATAELKSRVRERIRQALLLATSGIALEATDLGRIVLRVGKERARARLSRALSDFDHAAILTIHGFCQRALLENAFASGVAFEAELVRDPRPLLDEIVLDFWSRSVGPASRVFVEHLRDQGIKPTSLRELSRWVARTPEFDIVPQGLGDPSETTRQFGSVDTRALEEAVLDAREHWQPESVLVALKSKDLNHSKYPHRYLGTWCDQVTEMLESGRELPKLPNQFTKFCTSTLKAASKTGTAPEHPFFERAERLATRVAEVTEQLTRERLRFRAALVHAVRRDLAARKRERGLLTFDDLLLNLERALSGHLGKELEKSLRERYPVALIDEFQDTDPLQYSIFHRIYGGRPTPMFLIGDPKQAIYSFRGADVFAYLAAQSAIPSERRFTMGHNYRSDAELISAVNALFTSAPDPFFLRELEFVRVEARPDASTPPEFPEAIGKEPLQFRFVPSKEGRFDPSFSERTLPDLVARDVRDLLAASVSLHGRPLSPGDIAILTRTNAQAFDCQRALQRLRIPSVVLGDRSVFQYQEAEELQRFLAAALEPQNPRVLRAALCTELLGLTASGLLRLETDEHEWERWSERFRSYQRRWTIDGFVQMIRLAMLECEIAARLLGLVDGERRMTNLLHLVELLHVAASERHLGPSGLLHYLAEMRHSHEFAEDSEQIRLESDADTVTLTTVHKSKGLEYGVVFCPFPFRDFLAINAEQGGVNFHTSGEPRRLVLDLGSGELEAHLELMRDEAHAENLRLLYVALTRAKHRTVLYWCRAKGYDESALGYLLHNAEAQSLLGEPNRLQVQSHLKNKDDGALLARLERLASEVPSIGVKVARLDGEALPFMSSQPPSGTLRERTIAKPLAYSERTASFTELAHTATERLGPNEGRDHDELGSAWEGSRATRARCLLADFPGGARAGNFFHSVLEHWDFQSRLPEALVIQQLEAHGLEAELAEIARQSLREFVATPLGKAPTSLRLHDVAAVSRINELEFLLCVEGSPTFERQERRAADFTARRIADVLSAHPSPELPGSYAGRVSELGFLPLCGFLKGYIDLVFEHDGRWYLVDYKSNRLGEHYGDYDLGTMQECMSDNHYFLQYHLYAVALHRLLARKKLGYDYERDFGGVYYLFLRGMHPKERSGVFFEKPPRARIEALSSLFRFRGLT
jgi:exodeoxyribonuclease V beta subunit